MFSMRDKIILTSLVIFGLAAVASAGIGLRLPISIPFLSFNKPQPRHHPHHHPHHHQNPRHPRNNNRHHHHQNPRNSRNNDYHQQSLAYEHEHAASASNNHHHNILSHAHLDQQGRYYLHDPDSAVKFFYKEHLDGPSERVDVYTDGCREVPMDYWYNRPKSLWAKHCITLYQSGQCKGEGVKVAGMVSELRTIGMHYGVNSFKPCEKNIRIRFMPSGQHYHEPHHPHHHNHNNHV